MPKALLLLLSAMLATGQAPLISSEARKAMLDFQLNMPLANRLLAALPEMTRYVASLPDFRERLRKSATMTPAQQLAAVENDPKAMDILKRNNLTAKEYLVGVPALRNAVYSAKFGAQGNRDFPASPANLAFAKANLGDLWPRMRAADGARDAK